MLIFSPPPVVATQGDKVIMHVTNTLGDVNLGTALHTHGLFFNGSNWADGAVSTTQCPIPLNQTLSYEVDTSLQVSHDHPRMVIASNTDELDWNILDAWTS